MFRFKHLFILENVVQRGLLNNDNSKKLGGRKPYDRNYQVTNA